MLDAKHNDVGFASRFSSKISLGGICLLHSNMFAARPRP